MNEYFGTELTRGHMDQRMREAQAYRLARVTRAGRTAAHRSNVRRIAAATVHLLLWPVRH